jgi:hypothetical protein
MKYLLINGRNQAREDQSVRDIGKWNISAGLEKPILILLSGLEVIPIQPNPINFDRDEYTTISPFNDEMFRELEYFYDILGVVY